LESRNACDEVTAPQKRKSVSLGSRVFRTSINTREAPTASAAHLVHQNTSVLHGLDIQNQAVSSPNIIELTHIKLRDTGSEIGNITLDQMIRPLVRSQTSSGETGLYQRKAHISCISRTCDSSRPSKHRHVRSRAPDTRRERSNTVHPDLPSISQGEIGSA
jgi:hypothetical protein